ncbi:MAG TPA: hypothetical protein VGL69_12520 [Solirubrobacteraceae bacterium]|jgi:hypothetical protein
MATATQAQRPASPVRDEYRCECGHVLRFFGGGRHRVFFGMETKRRDHPVMNRACPECGRRLPGKGRPYAGSEAVLDREERS